VRREIQVLRVLKRACYTLAHTHTLSHTLSHSHTLSQSQPQEVVRVRREIELHRVLKHSNIVQLYQVHLLSPLHPVFSPQVSRQRAEGAKDSSSPRRAGVWPKFSKLVMLVQKRQIHQQVVVSVAKFSLGSTV